MGSIKFNDLFYQFLFKPNRKNKIKTKEIKPSWSEH
jgi:hypothetical protein